MRSLSDVFRTINIFFKRQRKRCETPVEFRHTDNYQNTLLQKRCFSEVFYANGIVAETPNKLLLYAIRAFCGS